MGLLQANGTAERDAALPMAERIAGNRRVTIAAGKGYDAKDLVGQLRQTNATPPAAQKISGNRSGAIAGRTTRRERR